MNDPGLDIENEAEIVENRKKKDQQQQVEDDEQAFLAPSRWWFASTAFPLIAGTFGPMASAFSICALAIHWRVEVPAGGTETIGIYVEDPSWLIGVNAAQLVIAVISNLSLLLNMAEKLRFSIAQPITITGWYISSFVLIGLTATAAGPLQLHGPQDYALSQAFYYAAFSAGLYFIVASLMLATVIGAHMGHYEKEFKLTMSQRTLMLQTISFLVYMLSGALVFAHVEGWAFLDAVYFTDFTLLTVGIGDLSPTTHLGRGLLFPYAIGGIVILGLVIGSIRSLVLERGKAKLGARMLERERERLLKIASKKEKALLVPVSRKNSIASQASSSRLERQDSLTEPERRRREFLMMRKVQELAQSKRRWTSLTISALTWLALWFVGAAVFEATEKGQQWSYFDALYFSYTSLLTIGYGDISPVSDAGKPFFVFWSLLAVPSLTILISNMGDTIVKGVRDLTLWIGTLTVLPGEHGPWTDIKETLQSVCLSPFKIRKKMALFLFLDTIYRDRGLLMIQITHRKTLSMSVAERPPGPPGIADEEGENGDDDHDEAGESELRRKNDPESAAQRIESGQAHQEVSRARREAKTGDENVLPESQRHYHSILIKEIGSVLGHLKSSPPRKYSFDEWAWYLKLIGEDESSPDTHGTAPRKPKPDAMGLGATGWNMERDQKIKWSWVGNRSPLMGNKEEAEWVLERLTKTLERELEVMRREEAEGKGDWAKEGGMESQAKKKDVNGGSSNEEGESPTKEKG